MDMARENDSGANGEEEKTQTGMGKSKIIEEPLLKEVREIFRCLNTRKANIDEIKNWCRAHPQHYVETQRLFREVKFICCLSPLLLT
jgi:hypothetical protein